MLKWGHSVQRVYSVHSKCLSQGQQGKDFERGPDVTRDKANSCVEAQVTSGA